MLQPRLDRVEPQTMLATLTITDSSWTTEQRLLDEDRESFIRRIVLGETPESATEETAA